MPNIQITCNGITKLLQNINPHKATGPDQIHGQLLKELRDITAPILTKIFTTSLTTGTVPLDWKHANVHPIYKKGDRHNPTNYRPVSLTSISCKLMEHIITSATMKHLETNNILYNQQHGFRASRSCETQLISFIHELTQNSSNNKQTDIIIMDFAKAFDKVPHTRLQYKLKYYGITGQTHTWITDFLTNRTQTVVLEGKHSDKISVTSGVPQGTCLGHEN